MLQASDNYIQAAISPVRRVAVKLIFPHFTVYDVINAKYAAETEPHIGGIEYRYLDVEIETRIASISVNDEAEFYIGFYVSEDIEWLLVSKLWVSKITHSRNSKTTLISMLGYTNKLVSGTLPDIKLQSGIYISDYIKLVLPDSVFENVSIDEKLKYAFYSSDDTRTVVDDLAKSINSFLLMRDEVPLFRGITEGFQGVYFPDETIKKIEYGGDFMSSYDSVNVNISDISESASAEVARIEGVDLSEGVNDIVFNNPVTIESFRIEGNEPINSVKTSATPNRLKLEIDGTGAADISVIGVEYLITKKTAGAVTNNMLSYDNVYIQTARQAEMIKTKMLTNDNVVCHYTVNPVIEVGDYIYMPNAGNTLIHSIEMTYKGGLTGRMEGIVVD